MDAGPDEPDDRNSGALGVPYISVAMATYNGEQHIREQLDSLRDQTLLPGEVVITDDGSTDRTLQIVAKFAERAPFAVRVVRNEARLGYANNFLKAAGLCQGKFVAFCDQDDCWLENKLAICSNYLLDESVALVVHSSAVWTGTQRTGKRFPALEGRRIHEPGSLYPFKLVPGFSMVFRRDLLDLADNADRPNCMFGLQHGSIMAHDGWIWLLATCTARVALLSDVLALYRQHGSNTVGAPSKWTISRRLRAAADARDYLPMAALESKAADILFDIAKKIGSNGLAVEQSATSLKFRSKLHLHRHVIYLPGATLLRRLSSFGQILLEGGYLPDRQRIRMGPNSALKDLLFGVTGAYKRITT